MILSYNLSLFSIDDRNIVFQARARFIGETGYNISEVPNDRRTTEERRVTVSWRGF